MIDFKLETQPDEGGDDSKTLGNMSEVASKAAAILVASEVAPAPSELAPAASELAPAPKPAPEPGPALDSEPSDGHRTGQCYNSSNVRPRV